MARSRAGGLPCAPGPSTGTGRSPDPSEPVRWVQRAGNAAATTVLSVQRQTPEQTRPLLLARGQLEMWLPGYSNARYVALILAPPGSAEDEVGRSIDAGFESVIWALDAIQPGFASGMHPVEGGTVDELYRRALNRGLVWEGASLLAAFNRLELTSASVKLLNAMKSPVDCPAHGGLPTSRNPAVPPGVDIVEVCRAAITAPSDVVALLTRAANDPDNHRFTPWCTGGGHEEPVPAADEAGLLAARRLLARLGPAGRTAVWMTLGCESDTDLLVLLAAELRKPAKPGLSDAETVVEQIFWQLTGLGPTEAERMAAWSLAVEWFGLRWTPMLRRAVRNGRALQFGSLADYREDAVDAMTVPPQ